MLKNMDALVRSGCVSALTESDRAVGEPGAAKSEAFRPTHEVLTGELTKMRGVLLELLRQKIEIKKLGEQWSANRDVCGSSHVVDVVVMVVRGVLYDSCASVAMSLYCVLLCP
jgi:hypothetical protein